MQDFLFFWDFLQEIHCKACKLDYLFLSVPHVVPQIVAFSGFSSQKNIHLFQFLLLGFHAGMGIELQCKGNFGMTEYFRQCAHVHSGLHGAGGKCVSQGVHAHALQARIFQCAVQHAVEVAALIRRAQVGGEYQIVAALFVSGGDAQKQLLLSLRQKHFLHLGGERDGAASGFGLGRARFQKGAGLRIL